MKPQTLLVVFLANGFVAFYYWSSYRHGMAAPQALLFLAISLIGVNAAIVLGRWLALRSPRRK
ncbi:MAG: hypothetical protein ABSE45_12200 [Candidatus Acidiferrales bacterium]